MNKIIIGIVALVVLVGLYMYFIKTDSMITDDAGKELRIGYIVYPPLLMKDAETGALSGISYEIVEATARELGLKTNWVEEVGWGTALEGLATNRYELLGTQMWPNEAREKAAVFSKAPMNTAMYPYVRVGDTRFSADNLQALNSPQYKIGVIDGSMEMFIAMSDYPNATLLTLPQLTSFGELFLSITQRKADVTFSEQSAIDGFNASQDIDLVQLGTTPVRSFGNSFAMKKENTEFAQKWNSALTASMDNGVIENILKKYGASSHYLVN